MSALLKQMPVIALDREALDWAVALACKLPVMIRPGNILRLKDGEIWSPHRTWDQTGTLLELFEVELHRRGPSEWWATVPKEGRLFAASGSRQSIAILRAIVWAAVGELVEVPVELLPQETMQ